MQDVNLKYMNTHIVYSFSNADKAKSDKSPKNRLEIMMSLFNGLGWRLIGLSNASLYQPGKFNGDKGRAHVYKWPKVDARDLGPGLKSPPMSG